ncbi:HAMP domain-containing sensor histidine kinase [Clostridium sp.]|uniref:HAMP domain-containing sensor histidine kinase n=1 Tax=Clostridium sp. TaxID=1506 RepID=UPI0026DBE954|nr:HAMP domain-containing sensor histidine kinase [Clostridium sp.]MDO5038541.1 HAMP domain-containing sensor histidine kinase [Clostridium sp.]
MILKMNLTLKQKIILTNISILIPIIAFIYIITFNTLSENLLDNSLKYLLKENTTMGAYIENLLESNKNPNKEEVFKSLSPFIATNLSNRFDTRVQIISNSGQIFYDSDKKQLSLYNLDIDKALEGSEAYIIKKIDGVPYIFLSTPIFYNNINCGVLRLILKNDSYGSILNNTLLIMILVSIISLGIGIILIYNFSKELVTPLLMLKDKTHEIANGNFGETIEIKSGDEVEDLANTFNIMSKNIDVYIKELKSAKIKQKKFFDNISHEFKTPLTAIIGFSEIIPKLSDKEKVIHSSSLIEKEGRRLLSLVEEILTISKGNKENFSIESTYIDIKSLIDECLSILSVNLQKYHIQVIKNYDNLFIYGDYDKTKQVFINILINSIKYSGCEYIKISSKNLNDRIEIYISDDGIGFDINNMSNINNIKGNGFGLNICKEILSTQNGSFKIESILDEGTTATLTFFKQRK